MAKERITSCEEYVLNILAKTEQDLVVEKDITKTLKGANESLGNKLNELTTLVREMAQHLQIRKGGTYDSLYSTCGYIGLVDENGKGEDDKFVVSLIRLAECVGIDLHTPVEREE